ncbi:MAG: hypothetical protein IJW54_01975 [Clostridia bacterium]|nr:hypothetical protein [Clostridia bacterium]
MGRSKCGFRKTKDGFEYWGDLSECVEKAKEKIRRLETESGYILRRFTEEEKRKNSHFAAIAVAKRFVEVVERQNIDKKLGVTEDSNND